VTSPPSAGLRPRSDPSRFHEKHPPRVGAFFAGLRPLVLIGGRLARRGGRRTLEELSAQRADATRLLPPPSRCSPGEDWSTVLPVRSLPLPASCASAPGFLCFRCRLSVFPLPVRSLPLPASCASATENNALMTMLPARPTTPSRSPFPGGWPGRAFAACRRRLPPPWCRQRPRAEIEHRRRH